MYEEFARIGADLFASGAVSSHGGNLSAREGDRLFITRTGAMLGHLGSGDVVETALAECGDPRDAACSVELAVHRAIYAGTDAAAVIHAHGVHVVARSLLEDRIVPVDSDARAQIVDVQVVAAPETIGSAETGILLAEALRDRRVAVLRGHGSFARGTSLENALQAISCLDQCCRILNVLEQTRHARQR